MYDQINASVPRKIRVWILLTFGVGLYFFANFQRVAIPGSLFNELQTGLGISGAAVSAFGSTFMYVYAVSQLIVGLLVDRYCGTRVIIFGGALFCIGCFIFPLSENLTILFMARALTGLGASSIYLSLVKETARAFSKNFTVMMGMVTCSGYFGGVFATMPLIETSRHIGWQNALLAAAVITMIIYCGYLFVRTTVPLPSVQRISLSFSPFFELLKNPINRNLIIFAGVNFGIYYVIQTVIGKKFLEDYAHFSTTTAAWISTLMVIFSALTNLVAGTLSRLIGNKRRIFVRTASVMTFSSCLLIIASLCFGFSGWILMICFFSFSMAASISPVTLALAKDINHSAYMGVSASMMNFMSYICVAVFGTITGLVIDIFKANATVTANAVIYPREAYLSVFAIFLVLSCIVVYNAFKLPETNGVSIYGKNMVNS